MINEKPYESHGKWLTINPYLNFVGLDNYQYSPEVWIVSDDHDPFDLPPELTLFDPEKHDYTVLREDVVKVWEGNHYDTTLIYTFTDEKFDYVIHEKDDKHGDVCYAVTRMRHHHNK